MNFLERLFGRRRDDDRLATTDPRERKRTSSGGVTTPTLSEDERAIERYRYLLRTAPPETIEEAHAEAFVRLTPEQRRLVLAQLGQEVPAGELANVQAADVDPHALARLATRAEARNPGTLERTWNRAGAAAGNGGIGLGGLMAGSFISTIAGVVVGTAIADAFFLDNGYDQGSQDGVQAADDGGTDSDPGDSGDTGDTGDGGFDQMDTGGDLGSDFGDFGDFGGGDFGGEF
jgi:hypothetical protein